MTRRRFRSSAARPRRCSESDELSVELLDDDPPTARVTLAATGASLVATIDAEVAITEVTVE